MVTSPPEAEVLCMFCHEERYQLSRCSNDDLFNWKLDSSNRLLSVDKGLNEYKIRCHERWENTPSIPGRLNDRKLDMNKYGLKCLNLKSLISSECYSYQCYMTRQIGLSNIRSTTPSIIGSQYLYTTISGLKLHNYTLD